MYSLGTRLSVYTANRGEISLENRNKISICAPTRLLKRLRQCNAERRGVKFNSAERRQKGGEGSLVPNVTRSQNQPSSVSYTYIYIYTRATLPPDSWTIATHRRRTTRLHEQSRVFCEQKKKKKSSRRPVQSCCDNNCLVTRGVGSRGTGTDGFLFVTAIVRTEPTGVRLVETTTTTTTSCPARQLRRSSYLHAALFSAQLYFPFIIRGERGEGVRDPVLSLSLSSLFRKGSLAPLASLSSPRSSGAI